MTISAVYPTEVKSAGLGFKPEASCVSSHTEELWYNTKSQSVDDYIYIYIYSYLPRLALGQGQNYRVPTKNGTHE